MSCNKSSQHHPRTSTHSNILRYSTPPTRINLRNSVGTTGNGLVATATLPDTNSLALDGVLSAEGADVAGVLLDFHLLHLLTQGGTVSIIEDIGLTIIFLDENSCPLCHRVKIFRIEKSRTPVSFIDIVHSARNRTHRSRRLPLCAGVFWDRKEDA